MAATPSRNDPCPCGSGRRYKHCCGTLIRARTDPSAARQRALALRAAGDTASALAAYLELTQLAPHDAMAELELGELLTAIGRPSEAQEHFRRCASLAPTSALAHLATAQTLLADGELGASERELQAALALEPASAAAHRLHGSVLAQQGRFAEAEPALARSLALDPTQSGVWYERVHCRRLTEADRVWTEQMADRLADPALPRVERMRLHFALGKACDDLRDYAQAIRHFDLANLHKRQLVPYRPQELTAVVDDLIATFTPEFIRRHAALGSTSERPLFIFGLPRSGTTLVEQMISNHPSVRAGGELSYWSDRGVGALTALREGRPDLARSARDDYLRRLEALDGGAPRISDKTPYNFFWLGLLRLLYPRASAIHCRRDPVDTCLSIYMTHFAVATEFSSDRAHLVHYWREYQRLVSHWRVLYGASAFVDADYEELVADPERVMRGALAACGLDWSDACLHPERNPHAITTASVWQARQPIYRNASRRAEHYAPWLGALRELLPPAGGQRGASAAT
jgi:tetratricopeptide (TPR) repeat protein